MRGIGARTVQLSMVLVVAGACAGDGASTTTATQTTATSSPTTTLATTTTAPPPPVVMPAPVFMPMRTFAGQPAGDTGFTLTLFTGSPLKAAIGAAHGFPEGCLGISLFSPDYSMRYFDGYVPTVTDGCGTKAGILPDTSVLVHTDRSIVIDLGMTPELPFIPAFQVMLLDPTVGWYSMPPVAPIEPAAVPTLPTEARFTHMGGDLFQIPAWDQIIGEPPSPGSCQPDERSVCLLDGRFRIEASFTRPDGVVGHAGGHLAGQGDAGFWFTNPANVELLVKLFNGCSMNDRFWVFASGSTAGIEVTVTDTIRSRTQVYRNDGPTTLMGGIIDTEAFATCP